MANADEVNQNFTDLVGEFDSSTGHDHDGSDSKTILVASLPTITAIKGGTGQTTYTQGDILYSSASNTLSKLGFGTNGYFLKTQGTGANPAWAEATAAGSAGGDLTGTYPNPTINTNKVLDTHISTTFMGNFSKVVGEETNTALVEGTFTNKWIIFSGYIYTNSEVESNKRIPGGANDDQSLGESFRVAGDDGGGVFGYAVTGLPNVTNDDFSTFHGRFYSESGDTNVTAFDAAKPHGLCVESADATNDFASDCVLYVDSSTFDLMLRIGTNTDNFVAFSIFITVLPDTAL